MYIKVISIALMLSNCWNQRSEKVQSTSRLAQNVFLTTDKVCPEPNSAALIVRLMRNIQFNDVPRCGIEAYGTTAERRIISLCIKNQ